MKISPNTNKLNNFADKPILPEDTLKNKVNNKPTGFPTVKTRKNMLTPDINTKTQDITSDE